MSVPEAGGPLEADFARAPMCGGRRERHRLKSGDGKTVSALTRMFVVVSSRVRWGLNWYLCEVWSQLA